MSQAVSQSVPPNLGIFSTQAEQYRQNFHNIDLNPAVVFDPRHEINTALNQRDFYTGLIVLSSIGLPLSLIGAPLLFIGGLWATTPGMVILCSFLSAICIDGVFLSALGLYEGVQRRDQAIDSYEMAKGIAAIEGRLVNTSREEICEILEDQCGLTDDEVDELLLLKVSGRKVLQTLDPEKPCRALIPLIAQFLYWEERAQRAAVAASVTPSREEMRDQGFSKMKAAFCLVKLRHLQLPQDDTPNSVFWNLELEKRGVWFTEGGTCCSLYSHSCLQNEMVTFNTSLQSSREIARLILEGSQATE